MSYPLMLQGDELPAVGVLQKLLNRTGAKLEPDGVFGPKTKEAVRAFQRPRGLDPDGVVGEVTWPRVSAGAASIRVVDCIDVFEGVGTASPEAATPEVNDIQRAGGKVVTIGGASGGVEAAVNAILRVAAPGTVFLLRFHGHGAPGLAGISFGYGDLGGYGSTIDVANVATLRPVLVRLKPVFGPYGCVQFMHCSTGYGASGRRLLQTIANDLGVPASAGLFLQIGGGQKTFRLEGPTFTALPRGLSLQSWCRGLPDFPQMNVL
jgi:hypothetical protein